MAHEIVRNIFRTFSLPITVADKERVMRGTLLLIHKLWMASGMNCRLIRIIPPLRLDLTCNVDSYCNSQTIRYILEHLENRVNFGSLEWRRGLCLHFERMSTGGTHSLTRTRFHVLSNIITWNVGITSPVPSSISLQPSFSICVIFVHQYTTKWKEIRL